jgi:large subunit ribosomal protein L21
MYAVVTTGGKQYRVEAGTELSVERLAADAGSSVTFDRVLLVGDGDTVTVGTPTVDGASVSGTVLGETRGPKLVIFKFKQKVKYRRTTGHRQHMTRVRIDEISAAGKTSKAEQATKTPAPKADASRGTETAEAPKSRRTRSTTAKAATAKAATTTKKTTARKTAAKPDASAADATTEAATEADAPKPKRTRKPAASKAKATPEPETEE